MKAIFLIQKEAWFIEHEQAWYRMNDNAQVGLALSGLPVNMVDQHDLIEQPHHAGSAQISQTDDNTLAVSLSGPDDVLIDTVTTALSEKILLSVDWETKQYRDGWMNSDASVMVEDVGAMYLEAYLPARSDSDGKSLTITNTETGSAKDVWLARNCKTRIPVLEGGCKGKIRLSLRCEPEEVDQSSDPRQLGFVLVGEEARPL